MNWHEFLDVGFLRTHHVGGFLPDVKPLDPAFFSPNDNDNDNIQLSKFFPHKVEEKAGPLTKDVGELSTHVSPKRVHS